MTDNAMDPLRIRFNFMLDCVKVSCQTGIKTIVGGSGAVLTQGLSETKSYLSRYLSTM